MLIKVDDGGEIASPQKQRPRSASPETATANKARKKDQLLDKAGLEVIRGRLVFAPGDCPSAQNGDHQQDICVKRNENNIWLYA